jgi:hypothetical protein
MAAVDKKKPLKRILKIELFRGQKSYPAARNGVSIGIFISQGPGTKPCPPPADDTALR